MNTEETLVCKNARVQLEVDLSKVFYFRPDRGQTVKPAAEIHLTPCLKDDSRRLKIYDERQYSVFIARSQANIRKAERESKAFLDQLKIDTAKTTMNIAWPGYLNSNAAIFVAYEEINRDQQMPILILRDAEEVEEDGFLTATELDIDKFSNFSIRATHNKYDSWLRQIMVDDGEIKHFLLVTVTSQDAPVRIFYRKIEDEKLTSIDYVLNQRRNAWRYNAVIESKIQLEGEPNEAVELPVDAVAELPEELVAEQFLPDPPATIEIAETPHKNGKIEAECPECDNAAVVRISSKMLGKSKCHVCKTVLVAKT